MSRTWQPVAEMSFDAIGQELGISARDAYETCKGALRKLREDPETLQEFAQLVRLQRALKQRQTYL